MSIVAALFTIVLPVFLLVGTGYAAVRSRYFADGAVDALLAFATNIAVPVLLFQAIYRLDLSDALRWEHLAAFYGGAAISFAAGIAVARYVFGRRPGEAVAVGFLALFSNSVLLGIPIVSRAYDAAELEAVFALVAFHAPFCYSLGILTMEILRRDGEPLSRAFVRTTKQIFKNALTIGILFGFVFNLLGFGLPAPVVATLDMLSRAALPIALFGLGGVLTRYAMKQELGEVFAVSALSLLLHPLLAYVISYHIFGLPEAFVRSAVVVAAMPPGINGYLFSVMYGRATGTAASTIILATAMSLGTITLWLWFLGGAHLV